MARRAAVIQAEVRDARARLLSDDLVQAMLAGEADLADEQSMRDRRTTLEQGLDAARAAEVEAEERLRQGLPRLTTAQETWYSLAALRERVATTVSIARERMRHADEDQGEYGPGGSEALDREATQVPRNAPWPPRSPWRPPCSPGPAAPGGPGGGGPRGGVDWPGWSGPRPIVVKGWPASPAR